MRKVILNNVLYYITFYFHYTQFREGDFILRDATTHKQHCVQIQSRADASKEYGINRNSHLNELRYSIRYYLQLINLPSSPVEGISMSVMAD